QEQGAGLRGELVEAGAQTEAVFGVVLKERVAPGRAATVLAGRVGRGRQVAAVDRGTAGGVGHDEVVAEELREELDVGRLAAAGAGAGKLETRRAELRALDGVLQERGGRLGQILEEVPANLV